MSPLGVYPPRKNKPSRYWRLARPCGFLTRLYDWIHTPKDALVSPKDPMEYWAVLRFHQSVSGVSAYGLDLLSPVGEMG